jgi:predicted nucleotidyltransferase
MISNMRRPWSTVASVCCALSTPPREEKRDSDSDQAVSATQSPRYNTGQEEKMPAALLDDPVLSRFRAAVGEAYGDRLERVVLFGSRARGDHKPDSDYDIAVFIKGDWDLWDELGVLAEITTDILSDTDAVISAKPFVAGSYARRSALMGEIRHDGQDL